MKDFRETPFSNIGITPDDLRKAILGGGDAASFIPPLKKSLGSPPVESVSSFEKPAKLPKITALLKATNKSLIPLTRMWQNGKECWGEVSKKVTLFTITTAPYGKNVSRYFERILSEIEPDVLALDLTPLSLRSGMLYAFSLPAALGLPGYAEMGFPDNRQSFAIEAFYPGSVRETAIIRSWLDKIPLLPVGMPRGAGDASLKTTDEDHHDEEMSGLNLQIAYSNFDESLRDLSHPEELEEKHQNISSVLRYSVSPHMSRRWEREARYAASRTAELASFLSRSDEKSKVLVIVDIKHYLEFCRILGLLLEGVKENNYVPPRSDGITTALAVGRHSQYLTEIAAEYTPETTLTQEIFAKSLSSLSQDKQREQITQKQADKLIARVAQEIRNHPDVASGVSVRGTIALREIWSALSELYNLRRSTLERAALIALPYRVQLKPGINRSKTALVHEIVKETLYDIQFRRRVYEIGLSGKGEWISADEITKSLEKLLEKRQSERGKEAVANEKAREALLKFLESKGLLRRKQQDFVLTQKSVERLKRSLEEKLLEGRITKDKYELEKKRLEAMLPAQKSEVHLSEEETAGLIMDFLDAIDRQIEKEWGKDINFLRMHTYYVTKSDGKGSPWEKDYFQLKTFIDDMERRGMLRTLPAGGERTVTGSALGFLLDYLSVRDSSLKGLENAVNTSRGRIRERSSLIRRYSTGDVFRDISARYTLREIVRQGKTLGDVREKDLRVHIKHLRRPQSDIVLCIDTSGSMGEKQKLTYARVIAALLARTAVTNRDRIGVVAFYDMGQTQLPLTAEDRGVINDYIVALAALGATNIGDGIKCATDLLFREANHNRKFIVLITDGEPNVISEKAFQQLKEKRKGNLTEESALVETRRAAARGVRVSVIHLAGEEKRDEFVKSIARAGKGKLMVVQCGEETRVAAATG